MHCCDRGSNTEKETKFSFTKTRHCYEHVCAFLSAFFANTLHWSKILEITVMQCLSSCLVCLIS